MLNVISEHSDIKSLIANQEAKKYMENKSPGLRRSMLVKPVAANDNLNIIVEIIKPVFLISCEYLSVYLNEINNSSTSTRNRIVKKSTKNKKSIFA